MPLWAYAYWALVGALVAVGVIGLLTIGIAVLAGAAVLALVGLAVLKLRDSSTLGIVGGLAVAPAFLAWSNREGPGTVCRPFEAGVECTQTWSPWPFAAVAVALALACVVLARRAAPRVRV